MTTNNVQTKIQAYQVIKDGPYSEIRQVFVASCLVDNLLYYKTLKEAKKELISDIQYLIQEYKDCLQTIRAIRSSSFKS